MEADVLIMGGGLAGMTLTDACAKAGLSVLWNRQWVAGNASSAAYGIVNPVHIRNFELSWKALTFYPFAKQYYEQLQQLVQVPFFRKLSVFHVFTQPDEGIHWRQAYETSDILSYCHGDTVFLHSPFFNMPWGGTVFPDALFIKIPDMISGFRTHLPPQVSLVEAIHHIEVSDRFIQADAHRVQKIIYADGVGVLQNPFFKNIPLRPCKGESLLVELPIPPVEEAMHNTFFLTQESSGLYRWGSTYAWEDLSPTPTEEARLALTSHLQKFAKCPFSVHEHKAGIRPAIADRRPVIGRHPLHANVLIMNGLGSRGLLLAPWLAQQLVAFMKHNQPIDSVVDVLRFKKRLLRKEEGKPA